MIRLFYNYYEDKHPLRKKEIDTCLRKNLENKLLDVVVFKSDSKPSYSFFFQQINNVSGPDDINIICNSDIFFDETIALAHNIKPKQLYALSRWDYLHPWKIIFFDRPDSQDTWIIRGKIENVFGDFTLGIRGCDNRIAYEFKQAGYEVFNPSRTIKTYHVHNTGVRNYTMQDVIPPPYLTIKPTEL